MGSDLLSEKKEIIRENVDGDLQGFDPDTGQLLWTQSKKRHGNTKPGRTRASYVRKQPTKIQKVKNAAGHVVLVAAGTNPDKLPRVMYPYCEVTSSNVAIEVAQGKTLAEVSRQEGMPPVRVIFRWMVDHPEFRAKIAEAKKVRAIYYHDMLMQLARKKRVSAKDVAWLRLKKDILQWGAEVGDPSEYGKQTKITGDATQPLTIVVNTGIQRAEDEKPIEVQSIPQGEPE